MIEPERGGMKFPPERILFLLALAFFAWQASGAVAATGAATVTKEFSRHLSDKGC